MADPSEEFRIGRHVRVPSQIRSMVARANREGRGSKVRRALESAIKRLMADPWEFGDPERDAKYPGAKVCHGFSDRVFFHFVIYDSERLVMLLDVKDMDARD
jgi:hypothetical protein